jgi:hypothetical protein
VFTVASVSTNGAIDDSVKLELKGKEVICPHAFCPTQRRATARSVFVNSNNFFIVLFLKFNMLINIMFIE